MYQWLVSKLQLITEVIVNLDDNVQEQDYLAICKGGTAEVTSEVWSELNVELEELQELSAALLKHVEVLTKNLSVGLFIMM